MNVKNMSKGRYIIMEGKLIIRSSYLNTNNSTVTNFMKDITTGPLTINKNHDYLNRVLADTAFKEIKMKDWREIFDIKKIKSFVNSDNRTRKPVLNLREVIDSLYEYIYGIWDISKFNLMFHSSGYDSRILSHLIKRVYDEKGGTILFVCFHGEEEQMANIMRYEGWDDSQVIFYDDYLSEDTEAFDFRYLFEHRNCPSTYTFVRPYSCVKYFKKMQIVPEENLRIWGGAFFNEAFKFQTSLPDFIEWYYYHLYSKGGLELPEFPITNFKTLKLIFEARPFPNDSIRLEILKILDNTLANLPRGSYLSPKTTMHPKVYDKLIRDYQSSFYYNKIDREFDPDPCIANKRKWWFKCSLASYIDHYIRNGVEIKY